MPVELNDLWPYEKRERRSNRMAAVKAVLEQVEAEIAANRPPEICARHGITQKELYAYRTVVRVKAEKAAKAVKKTPLAAHPWSGL